MIVTTLNGGARDRCSAGTMRIASLMLGIGLLCVTAAPRLLAQGQTLRELRRISAIASDLSGVGNAAVGPDGAIWFEQYEDGVIAGFAPHSTTARFVGRSGEGPGDLRVVTQLLVRPHDLWVADWRLQRTTSFDPSGRVNATTAIPRPEGLTPPRLQAATPAGATWWVSFPRDDRPLISVMSGRDDPPLTVLRWPSTSCAVGRRTKTGSMSVSVPYCHRQVIAFSPNGEFAAEALPLTLVDGSSGLQVVVVSVQGDTVLTRRLSLAASPIPSAARDSAIGSRLRRAGPVTREIMQEMIDRDLVPTAYSPVVDLRVSDVGEVVIDVVAGREAERHLAVLRRDTRVVSMLHLESNQSLRWFGGNRLLLAEEDEDGLQDVVLYEIVAQR